VAPAPSTRRHHPTSRLLGLPGIDLHDRRTPGLLASFVILTIIVLFVAGLIAGPLAVLARI
jgi:hypothetical protein